jgi:Transposase DDE domain
MLIMHTMSANQSLRQSHASQLADPGLRRFLGMEEEQISYSQLARSSTSRPSELFERLLGALLGVAHGGGKKKKKKRRGGRDDPEALRGVRLLDSTFFALGPKRSPWGIWNKRGNAGVRLQTMLDPQEGLPIGLGLEPLSTNDANALGALELCGLKGKTLVFDLGYYCHAHFERLMEGGVNFLTRLKAQASYEVTESSKLPEGPLTTEEGDTLISDEIITLGSPNNRNGAVLEGMRLLRSENEKGEAYAFVTDRHDLGALQVLGLYRKRWQIELFFRFLKRQLGALGLLGHSEEAVWLTILVAAIVAVMMTLSERRRPKGMSRVSWMRALCAGFSMLRFSG